ncbi:MAG: hypothetical protein H6962_08080 [Chromatiaceae bacterium]|nr:hypothetical protein [Chromatiaceae bacterium]
MADIWRKVLAQNQPHTSGTAGEKILLSSDTKSRCTANGGTWYDEGGSGNAARKCGSDHEKVSCIAVTAALAVATGLTVETALPQSRYDFDDQGRPVERYVVHASCNRRPCRTPASNRKARPGATRNVIGCATIWDPAAMPAFRLCKSEESLPGAMQAARRNYETTLQKIAAQRTSDLHSFLQKIETAAPV